MKTHTNSLKHLMITGVALMASMAHATLNVVATTADFGSLASDIGGDQVKVTVLAKPTEDPHFVDAKPSFIAKLARADMLIEGGAELEVGWLPPLLEGARNTKIAIGMPGRVQAIKAVTLLQVPTSLDRAQGDLHALGNPHFMVDPQRARAVAVLICDGLKAVDPDHAADYSTRCDALTARLDAKLAEWQAALAPYKGRHITAFHDSWPYFSERFGVAVDLFLEPKPGIPPSPSHLEQLMRDMKEKSVTVVLVGPYQDRKTAETLAERTGSTVLDFPQYPGGVKGTEGGYVELVDYLVKTLAEALGKGNELDPSTGSGQGAGIQTPSVAGSSHE